MILDVWRPRFCTTDKNKQIISYEIDSLDEMISNKKTGWKVRYFCDVCDSKKIETTLSKVFINGKAVYNTLDKQTCRSCRTKISEYEIKKSFIDYDIVKNSITNYNYTLLTDKNSYDVSDNKSQLKLDVICDNNHKLKVTWNNWNCGKRCLTCYKEKRLNDAVKSKHGWLRYKFLVLYYTEISYRNFKKEINPYNYSRGREYHLDHMFSIAEGFLNDIPPRIIGGYKNLKVIHYTDNLSKGMKCSITKEELLKNK